jgi:hypothetical protein
MCLVLFLQFKKDKLTSFHVIKVIEGSICIHLAKLYHPAPISCYFFTWNNKLVSLNTKPDEVNLCT